MKKVLSHGSGYLVIDHKDSPGLSHADAAKSPGAIAAPGGQVTEFDVMQCSHCQRGVALNPGRVRARAVCLKCHHYICDQCESIRVASGGQCVPFKAVMETAADIAEKFVGQPDHPEASIDPLALTTQKAPTVAVRSSIVLTDS
jgi:hypothetical protein